MFRNFLARLFAPKSFNDPTQRDRGVQTERAIFWLTTLILFGFAVIGLRAASLSSGGLQFFTIGIFAAIGALGGGAVLGLLFSLPVSNQQIVVVASGATDKDKPADPDKTRAAVRDSGYGDNSSLQQIGSWLTSVIVAVTLTQFTALSNQFETLASAVSVAMSSECSVAVTPAFITTSTTTSASASPAVPQEVAILPPVTQPVTTIKSNSAAPTKKPSETVVHGAACATAVPGGSIIGAYAILGFLLCYLWGRRYLATELASASSAARRAADDAEQAGLNRAIRDSLTPTNASPPKSNSLPIPEVSADAAAAVAPAFPLRRAAGQDPTDPWKGVFGGMSSNSIAELVASVQAVSSEPGQFLVDLRLRGIAPIQRDTLRGQPARIYLHPTYPDPVREVIFDGNGEVRLTLGAYGAFTIGAQLRDGTLLELDLVNIAGAPAEFKAR